MCLYCSHCNQAINATKTSNGMNAAELFVSENQNQNDKW